jgi:pimeloyl-ACP methyl ester carboxylesterase
MPTATVNGVRLHYDVSGEGTWLTLLHGFTLDGRMWADQVPAFATHFRVLVPDMRGFGRSEAVDSPHPQAADIAELLRFLGATQTHLVGLSMGGGVAVDIALAYPTLVQSLVLVDAAMPGFRWPAQASPNAGCAELAKTVGVTAARERFLSHPIFDGSRRRPRYFSGYNRSSRTTMGDVGWGRRHLAMHVWTSLIAFRRSQFPPLSLWGNSMLRPFMLWPTLM